MATNQAYSIKHRLFRGGLAFMQRAVSSLSTDAYMKMAVDLVEALDRTVQVDTSEGPILFHCDSEIARIRAHGMLIREPDTLDWIRGFKPGDTLLDIGSNVGVFTLFAAVARQIAVISCDPLPQNHYALARNIALNHVGHLVTPICVAINDRSEVAELSIPAIADVAGGAGATFGETFDNYRGTIDPSHILKSPGMSVDGLISTFGLPVPTHIKMDIDGIQDKVIRGAVGTLQNHLVKSVMLELNPRDTAENAAIYNFITKEMKAAGFKLNKIVRTTPNGTDNPDESPTNHFFSRAPK